MAKEPTYIYTYRIRYLETGKTELFSCTTENYAPPGAIIEKEIERIKLGEPVPWGEDNPYLKPQKKTFWEWLFGK